MLCEVPRLDHGIFEYEAAPWWLRRDSAFLLTFFANPIGDPGLYPLLKVMLDSLQYLVAILLIIEVFDPHQAPFPRRKVLVANFGRRSWQRARFGQTKVPFRVVVVNDLILALFRPGRSGRRKVRILSSHRVCSAY